MLYDDIKMAVLQAKYDSYREGKGEPDSLYVGHIEKMAIIKGATNGDLEAVIRSNEPNYLYRFLGLRMYTVDERSHFHISNSRV